VIVLQIHTDITQLRDKTCRAKKKA